MGRREISTERGKITQENVGHIITECMICAHGNGDGHYDSRLRANYTLYIIGPPLAAAQLSAQLQLTDQDSVGTHRTDASSIIRNIERTETGRRLISTSNTIITKDPSLAIACLRL